MERKVFRLHAHCLPVRGARRSTVCDLQRRDWYPVPNGLHEILTRHRDLTREELHAEYGEGSVGVIDEYFAFLEGHELGWWTTEPERFPPLDLSWEVPARITNAIVDVGAHSAHDFPAIVAQLEELGCRALQLRVFEPRPLAEVDAMLAATDRSGLRAAEVLLPWDPSFDDETLFAFCGRHPRLLSVFVHGAPERRVASVPYQVVTVVYRTERIDSASHCGEVHPAYFLATLSAFTEAQAYNSCLNRKLSVDEHGEIRNCPALPKSYGNAADTPLHAALEHPEFRDLWAVTKDQVETCRDCEFRYVCTDCRAHVERPGDRLSKPAKCAYDPYTATWREAAPTAAPARPALPVVRVSPVTLPAPALEEEAVLVGAP
jgi:SPASM domain peptide maturase of grasp-with-spasm system